MRLINHHASSVWCVVADEYGPEALGRDATVLERAPVQYRPLGNTPSLWERARRRAAVIATPDQVVAAVDEDCRALWQPLFHHGAPTTRVVALDSRSAFLAPIAAALLIAGRSPSATVVLVPARCHVAQEHTLQRAIAAAVEELPRTPQGILTLGMLDMSGAADEDYLLVDAVEGELGMKIRSFVRRPTPLVARSLRARGALVASGILIGYAETLAAAISRRWPHLVRHLQAQLAGSRPEYRVAACVADDLPRTAVRFGPFHPATLPQRVYPVCGSGWSGLRSPRSVERLLAFIDAASELRTRRSALSKMPRVAEVLQFPASGTRAAERSRAPSSELLQSE
jgi:hypothetical protein